MSSGIDLFERAAGAGARLLRVERMGAGLALTFDVGRITVAPEPTGGLDIAHPGSREEIEEPLEPLDEEEPWWRLLGSLLAAAHWDDAGQTAVCLEFHQDERSRSVVIASNGRSVVVRLASA